MVVQHCSSERVAAPGGICTSGTAWPTETWIATKKHEMARRPSVDIGRIAVATERGASPRGWGIRLFRGSRKAIWKTPL